ncbi:hypothetical protein FOG18_10280 [Legionella israelensis]|uniref:FliM/FliN family flagellar motor switch protein n=1 Tax=Legionella israelensis TaxID=454 RepID=UPI001180C7F2|nr:FliM/FliN family flagellar motor switch protein [Legionella israelensis]QDP72921.1 hypothetical protein FOG18_10280 [Legionella israelensis]
MNPYRLITSEELSYLSMNIKQNIQRWNDSYALLPAQVEFSRTWPKNELYSYAFIKNDELCLAVATESFIPMISGALFDARETEFQKTSECFSLKLIQHITGYEVKSARIPANIPASWQYHGHCTLALKLSCLDLESILLLNPEWVYQQLPKGKSSDKVLWKINDALSEELLEGVVLLSNCVLPLKKLKSLKPGDLLLTDHKKEQPLRLILKKQPIAEAFLGQKQGKKSIKIRSIL